jgi:Transglycosylase-like domain
VNVIIDTRTNIRRAVVLIVAALALGLAAMRVPAVASVGAQRSQLVAIPPLPRPHDELAGLNRARFFAAVEQQQQRGAAVLQLTATTQQQEQLRPTQWLQQRTAMWDALAQCESGGNWHVRDRFGGGLGIYVGTWRMFDGNEFAANPGNATKEEQIIVAERIYSRFGLSGWGCAHQLGWVN